jgi:hypothetical protein
MSAVVIGQTLYEPRSGGAYFREHTVVGIGRKWIMLDGKARCSIDGLMLDCGGYGPRQLYTDIEAYRAEGMLSAAWRDLSRDLQYSNRPTSMTVETINEIRAQLGLRVLAKTDPS